MTENLWHGSCDGKPLKVIVIGAVWFAGGVEEKAMAKEGSILFGVDDSVFARQAMAATGTLLKSNQNLKITIFHGAPVLELSMLSRVPHLSEEVIENYQKIWSLEQEKVLQRAREVLVESGFDPQRVSTIYEEQCDNPASAMYKLATFEDFETLALARGGAATPPREMIGSVTYRLANLADDRVLWAVDPRFLSQDVLVTLVGADISRRVMEHTVRYFSHLQESRFTLFHVIPPVPPQFYESSYWVYTPNLEVKERLEEMALQTKNYAREVEKIANEGKERLIREGVPEQNVQIKLQAQQKGIARDILTELEEGKYGILILGRKGFKDIKQFGLGSKANKLLHAAQAFSICLVN
ncbi:MAG: universal stress protein [Deltaproteobacteria bacterium]|nr:universal stress protein [Deltaproteobacteria bacterium]